MLLLCVAWHVLVTGPLALAESRTTLVPAPGQACCAIHVAEPVMAADQDLAGQPTAVQRIEANRRRLRESVKDLATVPGKNERREDPDLHGPTSGGQYHPRRF